MTGQRNKKSFIRLVKRSLVAGLLAGAMGLWGCGITDVTQDSEIVHPAGEDTITPIDDSLIVVGVSQVGSESVWRTANTNSIQETFTTEAGYFLIFENARQKETRLFFDIEDVDPVSLNKFVRLCASYGEIIISGYV